MLARAVVVVVVVVGNAVAVALVNVVAIANVGLVIAAAKLTFDVDAVVVRGSIGRVGWRKVRVRVRRTRRMCRKYLRRPWWSMWALMGFLCWVGASLKIFGMTRRLSKSGLLAKVRHAMACEWRAVYASVMGTL